MAQFSLSCRRLVLGIVLLLMLAVRDPAAAQRPDSHAGAAGPPRRPNILFITADDMSFDSLGCTGCPLPDISPNLDRLAREGLLIDHCHVASTVCGPSRAAFITGTWPQRNGTMGHYNQPPRWFGLSPITTTVPELLRAQGGYYTGVICKNPTAVGWDYEATHLDTGLGRDPAKFEQLTRQFIAAAAERDKPFLLHANSMDPHEYWAGQDEETNAWVDAMMGGAAHQRYANGKPYPDPRVTYGKTEVPVPPCWPDNDAVRRDIHTYYNSVRRLDETVGAILRAVEVSGRAEDTLVVFLADHGIGRAFAKWSMYPLGTRTPMIVRWPGVVRPGRRDRTSVVSAIDVAPTFLEAAGVPAPAFMDGRSILDMFRDAPPRHARDLAFTSFDYMNNYPEQDAKHTTYRRDLFDRFDNYRPMRALHSTRYTYVWNAWADGKNQIPAEMSSDQAIRTILRATGHDARADFEAYRAREEFYDTVNDPGCLNNLVDDPALAGEVGRFRAELLKTMEQVNDHELPNYREHLETSRLSTRPAAGAGSGGSPVPGRGP